jgi:hypothetical protein
MGTIIDQFFKHNNNNNSNNYYTNYNTNLNIINININNINTNYSNGKRTSDAAHIGNNGNCKIYSVKSFDGNYR